MGWLCFDDHPDADSHEGFVVGLVKSDDGWSWRELCDELDTERARRDGPIEVRHIQVACECGWRSPRLLAPLGTTWSPCSVNLPYESDEDEFAAVWRIEHRARLDELDKVRRNERRRLRGLVAL